MDPLPMIVRPQWLSGDVDLATAIWTWSLASSYRGTHLFINEYGPDCNQNGAIDSCEITYGISPDCDGNGIPDECDLAQGAPDCNGNGVLDQCDIADGSSPDCNGNRYS